MPKILPFRAIRYASALDLNAVTAPPYDVISHQERQSLQASHPHNVIRITLGGDYTDAGQNLAKYDEAARLFREWLAAGILAGEQGSAFYLHAMQYEAGGEPRTTAGLVAALVLENLDQDGGVYPHEKTVPGPVEDRLRLTRAVEANLEPLWFFASRSVEGFRTVVAEALEESPLAKAHDSQGVVHQIWRLPSVEGAAVAEALNDIPVVIADGHHRYQTALTYRDERRAQDGPGPWDATLAFIVDPVEYPACLFPIHRIARGISIADLPSLQPFEGDFASLARHVERSGSGTIGVASAEGTWTLPAKGLDTRYLAEEVLDPLGAEVIFEHDLEQFGEAIGTGAVGFVMAAVPINLVAEMALAGERMPPKTTLFWPKPKSGLLMRDLRDFDAGRDPDS